MATTRFPIALNPANVTLHFGTFDAAGDVMLQNSSGTAYDLNVDSISVTPKNDLIEAEDGNGFSNWSALVLNGFSASLTVKYNRNANITWPKAGSKVKLKLPGDQLLEDPPNSSGGTPAAKQTFDCMLIAKAPGFTSKALATVNVSIEYRPGWVFA